MALYNPKQYNTGVAGNTAQQIPKGEWAGGSYGRGYMQRRYNMNPSAMSYNNGKVTINGNPIYDATLGADGRAYVDSTQGLQSAIDKYAQDAGYTAPQYNPESDQAFQAYKAQQMALGNAAANNAYARSVGASGGAITSAARLDADLANRGYMARAADALPQFQQQAYGQWQDQYNRNRQSALDAQNTQKYNLDIQGMQQDLQTNKMAYENAMRQNLLEKNYADYQAAINAAKASPDKADDAMIPYYQAAWARKIQEQNAANMRNRMAAAELTGQNLINAGRAEENKWIRPKAQKELENTQSLISNRNIPDKVDTKGQFTVKDFVDIGMKMLNEEQVTGYDPASGFKPITTKKYPVEKIKEWVDSLDVSDADRLAIINKIPGLPALYR